MSDPIYVKINNISNIVSTQIPSVISPTPEITDNSLFLATTRFVKNYITSLRLILNNNDLPYTVDGIKTIPTLIVPSTLTSGISGDINIGSSIKTTSVNVLSPDANISSLYMLGQLQPLLRSGITGYSVPLVTNNNTTSKIQTGSVSATTAGSVFTFAQPFTAGCIPIIVCNSNTTTPSLCSTYSPSHTGFGANINVAGNVTYIAVGY